MPSYTKVSLMNENKRLKETLKYIQLEANKVLQDETNIRTLTNFQYRVFNDIAWQCEKDLKNV